MNDRAYAIGIDFGTESGRAVLLDLGSGEELANGTVNYPHGVIDRELPNTGEPLNRNRRWAVATNSIYHDPQHPSHIELPVIPAGK